MKRKASELTRLRKLRAQRNKEIRSLTSQLDSTRAQLRHATSTNGELAAHARFAEVQAGFRNAGDRRELRDSPFMVTAPATALSDSAKKLLEQADATPARLIETANRNSP